MPETNNEAVTVHNPLFFNEDFCVYTEALYNLRKKHPEVFTQLHEYASHLLEINDAVNGTINTAP